MATEPGTSNEPLRVLLSDGRYAELFGKPKYIDFMVAATEARKAGAHDWIIVYMAARIVKINGSPISVEQIQQLDIDDACRIVELANKFFPKSGPRG